MGERAAGDREGVHEAGRRRSIVVIDDLRTFAFDAVHARSSAAGIAVLEGLLAAGGRLDELWLDYNLGRGDNGGRVVEWLAAHADAMRPLIGLVVVHSSDPGGAARMLAGLRAAGYRTDRRWVGEPGAELR